jgi:hypothetical protein
MSNPNKPAEPHGALSALLLLALFVAVAVMERMME